MAKADRKLGWAFLWLASGIGTGVAMMIAAPIQSLWVVDLLIVFCGICFFLSAYNFGWFKSPAIIGSIGVLPRMLLIVAAIVFSLLLLRSKVGPRIVIEISKDMKSASIDIAPGTEAWIVTLKDDFKADGILCRNDGMTFINWAKPIPNQPPELIFIYHLFNHNSYSVRDLRTRLRANFLAGPPPPKVVASTDIPVYVPILGASEMYSFFVVNESHYAVMVDSPDRAQIQIPGDDDKELITLIKGTLVMGKFAVSDIKAGGIPLDLPLTPSARDWSGAGCN
jgi:hypothetical protein